MYAIEKITDKDGNEKTDRYNKTLKGCKGYITFLYNYIPMKFSLSEDKDGNVKDGLITTSDVEDYDEDGRYMVIYTQDSIYWLRKCS